MSPKETLRAATEGNKLFEEPMDRRRVLELANYWTEKQQRGYILRQKLAGASNEQAQVNHQDALIRYFTAVDLRDDLIHYLTVGLDNLSPELQARDAQFEGTKLSPRGGPCYAYLAWMLGIEPKEEVDLITGEILKEVSPAAQVKNLLANGKRSGYSRSEYEDLVRDSCSELTSSVDFSTLEGSLDQAAPLSTTQGGILYDHQT